MFDLGKNLIFWKSGHPYTHILIVVGSVLLYEFTWWWVLLVSTTGAIHILNCLFIVFTSSRKKKNNSVPTNNNNTCLSSFCIKHHLNSVHTYMSMEARMQGYIFLFNLVINSFSAEFDTNLKV